jgi:glycosyltransferase involved in cell wall biosynthesis
VTIAVSVVTVCLNDRDRLERTIESVRAQTFAGWELLVVDGGSRDGTLEVLERHADVIAWSTSAPDEGIFDAQNKGARHARGDWIAFLNAGDRFASPDALERAFERADGADVLYGDVIWEKPNGERWVSQQPDALTLGFFMRTALPHQATLVRRRLFERLGPFDTSFRIAADHAFFLNAIVVHGAHATYVPVPLAVQLVGGLSTSDDSFQTLRRERHRAKQEVLTPRLRAEWDAQVRAERGPVAYYLRNAFRSTARRIRAISRRLRNKPDCDV